MDGMNLQPHLGRFQNNYKPSESMGGYLALAKVVEVYHKNNTADVMIVRSNNALTSNSENQGRYAARIGVATAHHDKSLMSSSGVVEPIQKGQLVILAFLDGQKTQPVILTSFHDIDTSESNVLTTTYPLTSNSIEDIDEALKFLRVLPSQFYVRFGGIGGLEVSHPSKSFLKIDALDGLSDGHKAYDHSDLVEKDPATGLTRSGRTEEASLPVNMLYVHRSSFVDADTTWTKFFLDSSGAYRQTRDNNDGTLTYQEVLEDGSMVIRRQLDSSEHGEGQDYLEISITAEGDCIVTRKGIKLSVTAEGVGIEANTSIQGNLSVSGTITMGGKTVATTDQI